FLGALEMQRVLGYDAIDVGLAFLPVALGIAALSLGFAARLIMRFGAKPTLVVGTALAAVALLLFRSAPVHAHYVTDLLPTMVLAVFGLRSGARIAEDAVADDEPVFGEAAYLEEAA